jgi:hypothetical protein
MSRTACERRRLPIPLRGSAPAAILLNPIHGKPTRPAPVEALQTRFGTLLPPRLLSRAGIQLRIAPVSPLRRTRR